MRPIWASLGRSPILHAGMGRVLTVIVAATANYNAASKTVAINVLPAPLTVTADDASKVAGEANPPFTAHFTGLIAGDDPGALSGTLAFSAPTDANSPVGRYPITPGGLSSSDYVITYVPGTLTVAATPTPPPTPTQPVTIMGMHWETHKLTKKKKSKVLVVSFSGELQQASAQDLADYHLASLGKSRKSGTRAGKPVPLTSATYDPSAHTVTLMPGGKIPKGTLQLGITASGVHDSQGRPIDGNRDGQPGGDFLAVGNSRAITEAGASVSALARRVSAEALDSLLSAGAVPTARLSRRGL